MATSTIPNNRKIASVQYDIPNDASPHDYEFPAGFTKSTSALIGAKIYTDSAAWINFDYLQSNYWGSFEYRDDTHFRYQPKTAGKAVKIIFTFAKY